MQDHSTRSPIFPANLADFAPWVATHGLVAPYGKCQCGCGNNAPISDCNDRKRGRAKGQPLRFIQYHNRCGIPVEGRFWDKVDKRGPDECWEWQAQLNDKGYGNFNIDDTTRPAHRMSYILSVGPIPDGLEVCHKCDNPRCVNPNHLWLGTHTDNMQDMLNKGRGNKAKGEQQAGSKLTSDDVINIRLLDGQGIRRSEIAERYGVTVNAIGKIARRAAWKHVA